MNIEKITIFGDSLRVSGHKGTPPHLPRAMSVSAQRSFQGKRDSVPRIVRRTRWLFYN